MHVARATTIAAVVCLIAMLAPQPAAQGQCADSCGFQSPAGCWCDDACLTYNDCCGDIYTTCYVPAVASIVPPAVPTAGGTITIIGSEFHSQGPASRVQLLTTPPQTLSISSWSDSTIVATLPPGVGAEYNLRIRNRWNTEAEILDRPVGYEPPAIESLQPPSGPTLGGIPITLSGKNFGTAALTQPTVTVGSQPAEVVSHADNQLVFTLPPGVGVAEPVRVFVADQPSNTRLFSYEPPTISSRLTSARLTSARLRSSSLSRTPH